VSAAGGSQLVITCLAYEEKIRIWRGWGAAGSTLMGPPSGCTRERVSSKLGDFAQAIASDTPV
jgi:hypothetical protein